MQAVLIALAVAVNPGPVEQGRTDVTAYNSERSFAATLSFPRQFSWDSRQVGTLSLRNVSAESRYVFDIMWSNVTVHFENIGRGMNGPFLQVMLEETWSWTHYMKALTHGQSTDGNVIPSSGWDFCCAPNGEYKVNIVYDDSALWPKQMASQRVGRIVFPLTMTVAKEYLSFQSRKPKRNEVAQPVSPGFLCGNMTHKRDCRLVRATAKIRK